MVPQERWSPWRGGCSGRFHCILYISKTWHFESSNSYKFQNKTSAMLHTHWFCVVLKVVDNLVMGGVYCISTGELDPDRMGSGIQYGDPSLRRTIHPKANDKSKCACWGIVLTTNCSISVYPASSYVEWNSFGWIKLVVFCISILFVQTTEETSVLMLM